MKLFRRKYAYPLAAASLTAALAGAGFAYGHPFGDGGGPGFGGPQSCGGGHHGRFGRHGSGMFGQHVDGMLAFVKAELKITADQEPAWQEFSTTMRELAQQRVGMRKHAPGSGRDLPLSERIDRRLAMLEQGAAHLRQMAEAVKSLYADLTPEQQQLADRLAPMRRM